MGPCKQETGQVPTVSQVDAAEICRALNRIADAIVLLAQATAGEFDEPIDEEVQVGRDISGRPIK